MNSNRLSAAVWRTPGAEQYLERMVDDIAEHKSLLCLIPRGIDADEVWRALSEVLWRRDHHFLLRTVDATTSPSSDPFDALTEGLGRTAAHLHYDLARLMVEDDLPDVVYIRGVHDLVAESQRRWLRLFSEWVEASKGLVDDGRRPPSLCLINSAHKLIDTMVSDLLLSVHWWWAFPSVLETRLLCRIWDRHSRDSPRSLWREHVLAALAGADLAFVECLWDCYGAELDELLIRCGEYAADRGWTREALVCWQADLFLTPREPTSVEHLNRSGQRLWAEGVLQCTEYGLEVHSAALAALGHDHLVRHRIWRGQATFLLPMLEKLRLRICELLAERYGRTWPERWGPPDSQEEAKLVSESPLACSWGYLYRIMTGPSVHAVYRGLIGVTRRAKHIRNQVAHGTPVRFQDVERLWHEAKSRSLL